MSPITATVIETVEQLAKADGMNRLALHGKDGKLFYDSTWITTFVKTQTMRTLSNKTFMMNFKGRNGIT